MGKTIPVLGTAAGNVASVVLPQSVYAVSGVLRGVLQAKQDAQVITLASGRWFVRRGAGYDAPQDGSSGGGTVEVDATLTKEGEAADAKAVGDYIAKLERRIAALEEIGIPVTTADQLVSAVTLDSWKFNLIFATANTAYSSTAEAAAGFDDASWRTVSVPHDWSVELEFNASSPATYEGGYLDGGDAWYRTTVSVNKQSGRRYVLCFDGVYMESTVYVNGQQVHKNYYGYNPFAVDATEQMVSGVNTIAVFVRNEQPSSRWYSGSGMIRPVELVTLLDDQIRMENIRVTTPKLDSDLTNGETVVAFDAVNKTGAEASATFTVDLYDPDGAKVGTADASAVIAAGETQSVSATVALANPTLWAIGAGKLYEAQISAKVGNRVQRSKRVTYGYRSIRFDKDTGFYLNGIHTKLKGVCVHHDGGCIGAAENRSAIERQVDILTNMGCNAIRLTHNPFGAEYLDVCQRKGVLLVEELFDGWTKSKKAEGFRAVFHRPLRRSRDQRDSPRLEQSGGHHVVAGQRSAHEFDARRLFIQRDCERLHDGQQRGESPRQHPPDNDGQQRPRRQSICADGYRGCRWHQLQRQQPDLPDRPPDLRQRNDLGAFQPRRIRNGQREHGVSFLRQQRRFRGATQRQKR